VTAPAQIPSGRGFTLIEVAVALTIFAMSMAVLLEAQISSLNNANKARNLTIASILARSKMIDIEQKLFDEGLTLNEVTEDGDFAEEGHADYKWKYSLTEIELDLSSLTSLCAGFGGGDDKKSDSGCEGMLSGLGAPLESLMDELSKSMRMAELTVSWPDGKFTGSMRIRALLSRDDFGLQPATPFGTTPPVVPP
jgi:general secretion pathway protein I